MVQQWKGAAENVMGVAPGTLEARGRLAYVFYERIEDVAQVYRQDTSCECCVHELCPTFCPSLPDQRFPSDLTTCMCVRTGTLPCPRQYPAR